MHRRDFLALTGLSLGGLIAPPFSATIAAEELWSPLDVAKKKALADAALDAATQPGASYCDVRIGRYLRQFVITREDKVQNVVNTESTGVGVRVIANGAWGFAATNDLAPTAWSPARRGRPRRSPRPTPRRRPRRCSWPGHGRRRGGVEDADREERDGSADQGQGRPAAGRQRRGHGNAGANFVNSMLFLVNEQKYFASTDGSYIDQDVHRIWAPMTVTAIDKASGKFRTRDGLSAPMGMGFEYLDGAASRQVHLAQRRGRPTASPTT